eukprot:TRINITY_DN2218_c0_g1_i1.p2 TRINITY_DN2218_c0_g1~~TRINITY_DN2218_c0_g1_i1.p2  ORF type:complete len:191 (-),score=79.11 TRINITY_DN2218_c0_g1_i1:29-601(-)
MLSRRLSLAHHRRVARMAALSELAEALTAAAESEPVRVWLQRQCTSDDDPLDRAVCVVDAVSELQRVLDRGDIAATATASDESEEEQEGENEEREGDEEHESATEEGDTEPQDGEGADEAPDEEKGEQEQDDVEQPQEEEEQEQEQDDVERPQEGEEQEVADTEDDELNAELRRVLRHVAHACKFDDARL